MNFRKMDLVFTDILLGLGLFLFGVVFMVQQYNPVLAHKIFESTIALIFIIGGIYFIMRGILKNIHK